LRTLDVVDPRFLQFSAGGIDIDHPKTPMGSHRVGGVTGLGCIDEVELYVAQSQPASANTRDLGASEVRQLEEFCVEASGGIEASMAINADMLHSDYLHDESSRYRSEANGMLNTFKVARMHRETEHLSAANLPRALNGHRAEEHPRSMV
jgi:hypothetical protein